jgi:hypothetical protein
LNKTPNRFSTRIENVNIGSCSMIAIPAKDTYRPIGRSF